MAAVEKLRAVEPGERPTRKLTVAQAASSGSHLDLLISMRERIAKTVSSDDCPPRDLASLSRRLQDISKEIEALQVKDAEDNDGGAGVEDEEFDAEAI